MKSVWAVVLVALGACTTPNTTRSCSEGTCLNADFPYCDAEGVITGEPGTCVAVTCTPGDIETCVGDDALTCNATGDGYEHVNCDLGCRQSPTPHCGYIEPRYVPDVCDTPASVEEFLVSNVAMLDPNLDSTCNGGVVPQQGAPPICVLHYRNVSIAAGGVLKVTGNWNTIAPESVGRPVMLVADIDITVDGVLDISADGFVNGPGGGLVMSGGQLEVLSAMHKGAGGAGGRTAGAAGGSTMSDGAGGSGGLAAADPALLAVFIGGAAAHRFTTTGNPERAGGGGGGAAALVACNGRVSIGGIIDAGGGGGSGGGDLFGAPMPGYGGGAGGYVVLQAKRVEITGEVYANGGGGGTGRADEPALGIDGVDGLRSTTTGASGFAGKNGGGNAGAGGVLGKPPTVGGMPTATGAQPGGGGGSVGFLQTYTPDGIEPLLMSNKISPSFQPNITSRTR